MKGMFFMGKQKKDCTFCNGKSELFIVDGVRVSVFDIVKFTDFNKKVCFCPACGKELENG